MNEKTGMFSQRKLLDDFVPDEENLSEEAKELFPYHQEILRVFQLHRKDALQNTHMTLVGRHLFCSDAITLLHTYQSVLNYIAANKNIFESPRIDRPVIITGLPRTGSTLLFNLLACDPNSRAPYLSDIMLKCIPPIPRSDAIRRRERLLEFQSMAKEKENILGRKSSVAASHPMLLIDEDYFILRHVGFSMIFCAHSFDQSTESEKWLLDENTKQFMYEYHDIFLRMLNAVDSPHSHWIFKTPFHSLFLDTLLQHYPQARLIMTHRRLEDVIPSFCRLTWTGLNTYFDENDMDARKASDGFGLRIIDKMIERIMKFRMSSSAVSTSEEIFDVAYHDLMQRPIDIVRKIYEHFGLQYSNEFEVAMEQWLHDNPQGKQGRHEYDLSDVNLTSEEIEKKYAPYIDRFRSYIDEK